MKPTLIIIVLLTYAFTNLPVEITDNFLAYLIPFCFSVCGLFICLFNFRFIKKLDNRNKLYIKIANILTMVVFLFITLFNIPIPESSGLRCKNWTDIEMLINPNDNSEQYVFQSLRISGSIYSHRQAKVLPITAWLRWHHEVKSTPEYGNWLNIDNSKGGYNSVPFLLDNSKINFEKDRSKAVMVRLEKGQIKNP